MAPPQPGDTRDRRVLALLLCIAAFGWVVAGALRYGHSLTVDEPFMALRVQASWSDIFASFRGDNVPLAYVAFRYWILVFGDSEFALRALSMTAYAGAIFVTGLAGVHAAGAIGGVLSASLMAASYTMGAPHAAMARPYALVCAFVAVSAWLTIRLIDTRESSRPFVRRVLPLALAHLLGLFTHPTYAFVIAGSVLAALVVRTPARGAIVSAGLAAVGTYLVTWWPIVQATLETQAISWMPTMRASDLFTAYLLLWGTGRGAMLLGVALVLALQNVGRTVAAIATADARWMMTSTALAWALPFLASFWTPVFSLGHTPVVLLPLTALTLATFVARLSNRLVVAAVSLVFATGAVATVAASLRAGDPWPSSPAVAAVAAEASCGDAIVGAGLSWAPVEYYLRRQQAPDCLTVLRYPDDQVNLEGRLRQAGERAALADEAEAFAANLSGRTSRVWVFLVSRGLGSDASAVLEPALRRQFQCADPRPVRGAWFDRILTCSR